LKTEQCIRLHAQLVPLFGLLLLSACGGGGGGGGSAPSISQNNSNSTAVGSATTSDSTATSDTSGTSDGDETTDTTDTSVTTTHTIDTSVVVQNASFSEIQTVFDTNCAVSGCHDLATSRADLSLEGPNAYAQLVNVSSTQDTILNRIEPGDPDNSYLIQKLEGLASSGAQMPFGRAALSSDLIDLFRDWILAGAVNDATSSTNIGHPTFASPHANPIVINGSYVYVTNTPSDTVDVVAIASEQVVATINVGIDPVGLAVRPDGNEIWVANHVSDSVSVIDTDTDSPTFHQVIATIQDIDAATLSTRFDEPVGIAFANNSKAYVALSPSNQVAIVNGESYSVTGHLPIRAQDPRAITVRGNRLFVIPFESNNQSQLSGCTSEKIDGDICTFDAVEHVFSNNNVLSVNYDADIIKNPLLPDRDLYIFDTENDTLLEVVDTVGTLLYGVTVDSGGRIFVTQTDARNTANGRAGTEKHGLEEMENRAFLNQVTMIDCQGLGCSEPVFFDLEPLPPSHPEPGMALATPFGIQVSDDDSTLVVTAASSDKLFTMDANTGVVLGRTSVGSVPRGVALLADNDGNPTQGWVLNTVGNTVSVVDLTSITDPTLKTTIPLGDPTDPEIKVGRIAFNDADASSTGTFSCESCHPDGGTDQLIWVLQTPICDVDGCTQIPPRLTMPIRGLRDTAPYHWDGIPGDPFGGNNTQSINSDVEPNCSLNEPEGCTRVLADGAMATTMCDVTNCPDNDEGKAGLLSGERRDAMAKFLLSVPFPPSQTRPITNKVTQQAKDGFFEFNFVKDCGNCHKMPFLVSTNTGGTGMDAPTWRGAYDRWMVTPQARLNIIDLMNLVGMDNSFPERDMWILAGATPQIWEMVVQGSTGFSGAFGRQVTLNEASANLAETATMLDYLERAATEGSIVLQAEGAQTSGGASTPLELGYVDVRYVVRDSGNPEAFSREELVTEAANGAMVLTITSRLGPYVDYNYPQPALWNDTPIQEQTGSVEVAFLSDVRTLRMRGRHLRPGARVFIDGQRVEGQIRCESGSLPNCDDEIVLMEIDEIPEAGGMYLVQAQNPDGLFSNDALVYSDLRPIAARSGNLIESGGTFNEWDESWGTTLLNGSVRHTNGMVQFDVDTVSSNQPWRVQLFHRIWLVADQEYTFCYRARTTGGSRIMTAYLDAGADGYANISNGQREVTIDASFKQFSHSVTIGSTDTSARIAFDMAQSTRSVQLDDIGIYEGDSCGTP
jgi:YVTN family beta-propeller protein|tara:strand:- start:315 stop:4025 length:3711 start_codon:yes stop_codon:yes gene_type:complete